MSSISDALAYFISQGWSRNQAAGVVGNLTYEGTYQGVPLNPAAVGDNGSAYGIGQWHSDRQAIFQNVYGKSIRGSTLQEQLQFVQYELTHTEQGAYTRLSNTSSVGEATTAFMAAYERPSPSAQSSSLNDRIAAAQSSLSATNAPSDIANSWFDNLWNSLPGNPDNTRPQFGITLPGLGHYGDPSTPPDWWNHPDQVNNMFRSITGGLSTIGLPLILIIAGGGIILLTLNSMISTSSNINIPGLKHA